jgi:hypothetical protein
MTMRYALSVAGCSSRRDGGATYSTEPSDPHFFARAQAIRSLGWVTDPTFIDELHRIRAHDASREVKRTAAKALQRIIGYWMYFGEWEALALFSARALETAHDLAARGLPSFAFEVLLRFEGESPASEKLAEELEPLALASELGDESRYYFHFKEAAELDQRLAERSDVDLRRLLGSPTEDDRMEGLYLATRRGDHDLVPLIRPLTSESGAIGWNARRAMRRLDAGTLGERRWSFARCS